MIPPLRLNNFSTTGPTGDRDNLLRLQVLLGRLTPAHVVVVLDVAHDDGCPCADGKRTMAACICESVDLTVRAVDARKN